MRIRTRIFIGFFLLVAIGFYVFSQWILDDVRKSYLESVEENLVETANVLAAMAAENVAEDGTIKADKFETAFQRIAQVRFKARIYSLTKEQIDISVYIADANGTIVFDSLNPDNVGSDYSRWNDVRRTLQGEYGARATRTVQDDPTSLIMYVASPITVNGEIVGSLTVCKPIHFISQFITEAKHKIIVNAIIATILVCLLGILISAWLTHPIHKLTNYAKMVRDGRKVGLPRLGKGELSELGTAFEEMREALEGKKYVEQYVQNLTHELKSPLSAIQGASELLVEPELSPERKERFLANIQAETVRMRKIVDRMLQLSVLEARNTLTNPTELDLVATIRELIVRTSVNSHKEQIVGELPDEPVNIIGEEFLIYEAIDNLLRNALDFSPAAKRVTIKLTTEDSQAVVQVTDAGPGIPDFALERLYEKFYSLPRPETGKKSSGLGLSIVKEIVQLHSGSIELKNLPDHGVQATLKIPLAD